MYKYNVFSCFRISLPFFLYLLADSVADMSFSRSRISLPFFLHLLADSVADISDESKVFASLRLSFPADMSYYILGVLGLQVFFGRGVIFFYQISIFWFFLHLI